jgi:transcriptional regulator with XRE-family HTH domain
MNPKTDYGTKLRLLRTEAKLTQEGVASTLGISQKAYSDIESDKLPLRLEYIDKLASLYKTDAVEIAKYLMSEDKIVIHKIAETNGAFTAQGSVVQNQGLDSEKERVLFEQLAQMQEINKFLLAEIKAMKGETNK